MGEESSERRADARPEPQRLVEVRREDGFFALHHPDLEKPRYLTPQEKISFAQRERMLAEKAEIRAEVCWCAGCNGSPLVWVRSVNYDFKGEKAEAVQHTQIDSSDYPGPVPGFCLHHQSNGPAQLAEAVYWDRSEVAWGAKPTRWFVVWHDGLVTGGECISFDPQQVAPTIALT